MEAVPTKTILKLMIPNNNGHVKPPTIGDISQFSEFVIANYLHLLDKPEKGEKGKYICPNCSEPKLSISQSGPKKGIAYNCYGCHEPKKIAYKLRELNGEFNKKPDNSPPQKSSLQKDLLQVSKELKEFVQQPPSIEAKDLKTNVAALNFIRSVWGEGLSFNLRTLDIELHGQKLYSDTSHFLLADEFSVNVSKDKVTDACKYLAQRNPYDPVKNWLESLRGKPSSFGQEGIAKIFFKIDDPYYDEMIWKWMIAAVKIVYEPGAKFDNALILQGKPKIGKTSFLEDSLIPNRFYSNQMKGGQNLDTDNNKRIYNEHWIADWGELARFTNKEVEQVKNFLSTRVLQLRIPYDRSMIKLPKRTLIAGTVNDHQFLNDKTGNRRFWVLELKTIIHPADLKLMREEIWSGVLRDYFADWVGEDADLELSPESYARQLRENEKYLWSDLLEDILAEWLVDKYLHLMMKEIVLYLYHYEGGALGIKPSDKHQEMRIGKIMNKLGWVSTTKRIEENNRLPAKVWVRDEN
jgi:hypothetical protein